MVVVGLNGSKMTDYAHAMSYKITSLYGLPHGHAVAVCLPVIWEYMIGHKEKCIDNRGQNYLNGIFNDIAKSMGKENPTEAIKEFRTMMIDMELDNPVSDYSHRASDIDTLSISVNPVRLKNNPVQLNNSTIMSLYEVIVK